MSEQARKRFTLLVQVAISGCLLLFVFLNLDFSQVKALAFNAQRAPWLLAAFVAFNASKMVSAWRLNIYQRHAGIPLCQRENLRLYYAGMFLNLFLPGGIGGDGYKILVLRRRFTLPLKKLVAVTLADRVSGLLALLFILCLLVPWLALPWPSSVTMVTAAAAGIASVAAFVVMHRWMMKLDAARLVAIAVLGLAVQCLQLACMAMLLAYLNIPAAHYPAYFAVFLVSSIAAVLPLSFGGLGAREFTFLFALNLLQLEPTYGVVASSWFFVLVVLSSMIGALFIEYFRGHPGPEVHMPKQRHNQKNAV